jgi:hypothetical protein
LLDQKEAKLKTKRCFCALAFTLARRLVGPRLFLFCSIASSFCHPEPVEGYGHPLLSSCIGAVAIYIATVTRFIGSVRSLIGAVRLCIDAVGLCIVAVRSFSGAVRLYIGIV